MLVVQTECYHRFKCVGTTTAAAAATTAETFIAYWLRAQTALKIKN
jgi:hypothetical protein